MKRIIALVLIHSVISVYNLLIMLSLVFGRLFMFTKANIRRERRRETDRQTDRQTETETERNPDMSYLKLTELIKMPNFRRLELFQDLDR